MNAPIEKKQLARQTRPAAKAHLVFRDFVRALEKLAAEKEKRARAARRRRAQA